MIQKRFTGTFILCIEKNILKLIDTEKIENLFAEKY
jgi:hypothetical protein